MHPKVFIFSAPSGSGKTTIVKHLLAQNSNLGFSISVTTRPPRNGQEINGRDYYFWSVSDFKNAIDKQEFVEWENVYQGVFYGTLKSEIERLWAESKYPLFDVDVKGGLQLKKYFKESALAIFVKVESMKVLEERLRDRNTETQSTMGERLEKARLELTFADQFDSVLVNDQLDQSLALAQRLVDDFLKTSGS